MREQFRNTLIKANEHAADELSDETLDEVTGGGTRKGWVEQHVEQQQQRCYVLEVYVRNGLLAAKAGEPVKKQCDELKAFQQLLQELP